MEEKKVPALRFRGFDNAWEQHKLGEVATYRRGSFPQPYGKSEWYDGNGAMPFVQVADVSDEMNLVEDTKQKISILAQPMSVFVEQNSVLVTLQGSIGRVAIMQYDAFVDRTVLIFEKYKAEIDKTFWAYIIKQKFIDEARKAPGGTIKTITKEALSDFDLSIPKYQEQKQIGEYFRNLDHLISLHQRKLEMLKKVKKSMLEKMFPKNDAKVPEVRFSDFTDAWEQRKLSELADIVGGGTPSTAISEYWDGDIDWYAPAEIADQIFVNLSQKKITTEGLNNSSAKMLPVGTVLFTSRAGIGKTAILTKEGCTNQGFQSIIPHKDELDSYFVFSRTDELKRYGETVGAGSTFVEVSGKQMANMTISIPATMGEQRQIGTYFRNLDNLIILHQRKLEKLKNIKKSMLEKMFII